MIRILIVASLLFRTGVSFAQGSADTVTTKSTTKVQYGTASYYSNKFEGKRTASGEIFSQKKMTAAHNSLPLGTWIKVTNTKNGKWAYVKVNDHLHTKNKRVVDLSAAAAQKLGYYKKGLTKVKIEIMGKTKPEGA